MGKIKFISTMALAVFALCATAAKAEWTTGWIKGEDGQFYKLYHAPDGKSVWTDAFLEGTKNAVPKNDVVKDGQVQNSPAAEKCEAFGKLLNFEREFPGRKMTLPSALDYEKHLIAHFKHKQSDEFKAEGATRGLYLADLEQIKTIKESGEALFDDMTGNRFWTSSVHPEYTDDAFFFDGDLGNAGNFGARNGARNFVRCIGR